MRLAVPIKCSRAPRSVLSLWWRVFQPSLNSRQVLMLKIQNLSVSYHDHRVLHDVSFDVKNGEVLALIGPNGAGKSTIIRAASGVIPSTGNIRTNGNDFHALTPIQRARYLAVVPQAVSLPPAYTVWETILLRRTPYLRFLLH